MSLIKVAVSGCMGRMGIAVCETVMKAADMKLSAVADSKKDAGEAFGLKVADKITRDNSCGGVDVMVDFTHPSCVYENAAGALRRDISCIIGTTGLTCEQREELKRLTLERGLFTLVAPNFAIGAVLMMKFSAIASKFMGRAEIIEMHHDKKADAPSGTALLTAEMMAASYAGVKRLDEKVSLEGARGGESGGVNIHSVRLPGFLAHQQVIFGDAGQVLTIRHDSMSRDSFMPGVALAIRESVKRKGFYFGLETIMDMGF
ncbi:MAG TPA: 4-hydroxy-tetrahydrodipicolinate reductase [Candidatus Wallbacteria bacterium]|nr:MAG: 4-hydroxy-tetrahydrodipicolinate reductase [bacterium ADurb.Bin243]HOD42876.1 4-hydroxy-tetrahydrodipicolinate reductase [Candidatus Wallbacteria bacterium]HPG57697.1 4-hydroxy-tetrahydrodipicolinate reductase [Candidatus Wallbacteria bacterium]